MNEDKKEKTEEEIIDEASSKLADIFVDLIDSKKEDKTK